MLSSGALLIPQDTPGNFIARHPVCAFCAGERPTASRDHQPPRVWFRGKRVPDNVVVPACDQCQSVSRLAEHAISLLFLPERHRPNDLAAWSKRLSYSRRNAPELVPEILNGAREARSLLRELGLELPAGMTYADAPIAVLDSEHWNPLFAIVAKKLTLAQHYRCFGKPLPRTGRLFAYFVPNAHANPDWERGILEDLPNLEVPRHGNEDLGDQVMTRWNASQTDVAASFLTRVQSAFYVHGTTGGTVAAAAILERHGGEEPFVWSGG